MAAPSPSHPVARLRRTPSWARHADSNDHLPHLPPWKNQQYSARIADEYWRHLQDSEVYLKRIDGLPIVELPDVSEKKDQADAAFAQRLLKELDALKT